MNEKRVTIIRDGESYSGPVVYWMSRDQRVADNWALLYAQDLALQRGVPLGVIFCLVPDYLGATARQYGFMLRGLMEVQERLQRKGIPFHLQMGKPSKVIPRFIEENRVSLLVADFNPLRIRSEWNRQVAEQIAIPFFVVDSHNIVPCWVASPKQEYAARTFRPKIGKILPEFLTEFPPLAVHTFCWKGEVERVDRERVSQALQVDSSVDEVRWIVPGERSARMALTDFLEKRLACYSVRRNDPTLDGQSGLSPYLHFGQLSAQRAALEVQRFAGSFAAEKAFLEELIVRRELCDNFCYYNSEYDNFNGFPRWARDTLARHRHDRREYLYTREQFQGALTHDPLWNAAQQQMLDSGKMPGYLRMYWAKKILEWSATPEEALETAIYLNDRFELDGRDPCGYVGIAWSIGGVHDRPWPERPVSGTIRSMSFQGCRKKFDVEEYLRKVGERSAERLNSW
ncbi:MAG: deoxyribodipyrimidine photo-lyase [Deltaproteobacteria bacterium]|nr:deoxyribodipyrimidine photo-lyase [Deltaproteobacteria bacterium]